MTRRRLPLSEFVALIAILVASAAFAIDTMLPGLPRIGAELNPADPNRAQFVVTAFIMGMGFGTLVAGPISDAVGRRGVIFGAAALYIGGALASYAAPSIEVLIAARVLQGIGASGPRAVGLAIVRDLYAGRQMARIMSFAMMVFSLVPAAGPLLGSFIIAAWGWREVFLGFALFMAVAVTWYGIRQAETLVPDNRRPLRWHTIRTGLVQVARNRTVVVSILVMSLNFGILFTSLVSIQPVFQITFGRGASFPWYFALISVISISASLANALLVTRLGMRALVNAALLGQTLFAGVMALSSSLGLWSEAFYFPVYFVWVASVFWMMGLTIGNLNALALEPMGHIAGLASSVVSAASTVLSMLVAVPIGLAFDGTPVPAMTGTAVAALAALILMLQIPAPRAGPVRP